MVQHVLTYIDEYYKEVSQSSGKKTQNLIALVQSQIGHLQASNGHQIAFQALIQQGNENGAFSPKVPAHELLWDMPVCWDSTYLMIEQFSEM